MTERYTLKRLITLAGLFCALAGQGFAPQAALASEKTGKAFNLEENCRKQDDFLSQAIGALVKGFGKVTNVQITWRPDGSFAYDLRGADTGPDALEEAMAILKTAQKNMRLMDNDCRNEKAIETFERLALMAEEYTFISGSKIL